MLNTTGSEEATRWQVPLAPGPAVILRQSERWWGWSRSGSRLPSCPVRLLAGPEVGGSSPGRDHHAAACMVHFCSANAFFIVGFSSLSRGWEHAAARLVSMPARSDGAYSSRSVSEGGPAPPLWEPNTGRAWQLLPTLYKIVTNAWMVKLF